MRLDRKAFLLGMSGFLALLAGCASTNVTPIGEHTYPALPSTAEVRVFASEKDVGQPYEALGIVEYSDPGKWQNITLEDALPHFKEKARLLGANAIIIDSSQQTKSGIWSRGIDARARAIRLKGR